MRAFKELRAKVVVWFSTLRKDGFIEFLIQLLRYIQKRLRRISPPSKSSQKHPIHTKAGFDLIENVDFSSLKKFSHTSSNDTLSFAWIMPPPGKGSGGHLNIFRFIEFLETAGHSCSIYLYVDGPHSTISAVKDIMGDSYPDIQAARNMKWLDEADDVNDADGIFCTSWETAYASYNLASNARRFYFVQDFEPYFYARGGMYTLAENTYKLGFYGVTAGKWLEQKLRKDYGMKTSSFDFGADQDLYRHENDSTRKEIFCYVRPYTERRGFEVAMLALDIFHKEHPDYVINLVGWDVSEYDIPFPYTGYRTLEVSELSTLYNRCIAGLVLSYTNMSLLPLELLACGTIPVVNDAPNTRLVSDNPYIAYSSNDAMAVAASLGTIVKRADGPEYARKASASIDELGWAESGKQFVSCVEKELKK